QADHHLVCGRHYPELAEMTRRKIERVAWDGEREWSRIIACKHERSGPAPCVRRHIRAADLVAGPDRVRVGGDRAEPPGQMRDDALRAAARDGPRGNEEEGLAAVALQAEETAVVRRAVVPSGTRP